MKQLFDELKTILLEGEIVKNVLIYNNHTNDNLQNYTQYNYPLVYVDFSTQNEWQHLPFRVRECTDYEFNIIIKQENYVEIEDKDTYTLVRSVINTIMDFSSDSDLYDISRINYNYEAKDIDDTNIVSYTLTFTCNIHDYSFSSIREYDGGLTASITPIIKYNFD